jgi:stringent starvation protein B
VKFEPSLPKPILDSFSDFTMFALVNYTFSTIDIQNNTISFEASFGRENFICSVSVPFFAIFQIIVDGSILCLNPTAKVDKFFQDTKATKQEQQQRSKNAFIFNPTNKDKIN